MKKITECINRGDEIAALEQFDRQWDEFPWYKRYLALLFPAASACLELSGPAPHALKYHHALWKICAHLPGDITKFLLRRYIQYICRQPRFRVNFGQPEIVDDSGPHPPLDGLTKSLKEKAFGNALYHLMRLRREKGFGLAAVELLKICSRNIDPLGHNFTCAQGIIEAGRISERRNEGIALAVLLEFTLKNYADAGELKFKAPRKRFPELLRKATFTPGLLGHHLIFAHRIDMTSADKMGTNWRRHLEFFLESNLQEEPEKYPPDFIESLKNDKLVSGNWMQTVTEGLLKGDLQRVCVNIIHYLKSGGAPDRLFENMIVVMACVDKCQPHFYTYPLAVKELAENHPELTAALYCGWADFIIEQAVELGWIDEHRNILNEVCWK